MFLCGAIVAKPSRWPKRLKLCVIGFSLRRRRTCEFLPPTFPSPWPKLDGSNLTQLPQRQARRTPALERESIPLDAQRRPLRRCPSFVNSFCCGTDHVEDAFRLGKHRYVASVKLIGGCGHALGPGALQIGTHRLIFLSTMYQLDFDFHAVPPAFASNRSGFGTPWVAQTTPAPKGLRRNTSCLPGAARYDHPRSLFERRRRSRDIGLLRLRCLVGDRCRRADVNQRGKEQ